MRAPTLVAVCVLVSSIAPPASALSVRETASGQPIAWRQTSLAIRVDPDSARYLGGTLEAVQRAADEWASVPGVPRMWAREQANSGWGYVQQGLNANTLHVVQRDFPTSSHSLAITLVTSNTRTGEILDADVLVDASRNRFAILGPEGMLGTAGAPFDLQNTLAHELGHVLGLGEDEATRAATMYPTSAPGEVSKRDLDAVDRESVRLAYHGLTGGSNVVRAGCGGPARVAPASARGSRSLLAAGVGVALLALVAWGLRRRARVGTAMFAGALLVAGAAVPDAADEPRRVPASRVLEAHSAWRGGVIWTRVTLRDGDGRTRTVEQPGGRVGEIEQRVFDGAVVAVPDGVGDGAASAP